MERPPMGPPPADGPKPVIPDCAAFGIPKESICAFAPADLDGEGGFRLSYLLLTESELIRLTEPEGTRRIDFTDKKSPFVPSPGCAIDRFPLDKCGALTVEPQVASVVVTLDYEGKPLGLATATNARAAALRDLAKAVERAKKPDASDAPPRREKKQECCPRCGTPYRAGTRLCPKCHRKVSLFFRLLGFFKPYALRTVFAVLCFVGTALVGLATPYLSGSVLYGKIFAGEDALGGLISPRAMGAAVALLLLVLTMLAIRVASQLFSTLHGLIVAKTVPFVVKDIKNKVFASMNRLSLRFFQSRETGGLMTRVLDDAYDVTYLFIDDLPAAVIDGITLVVAMVILFLLNAEMAALALVMLLPAGTVTLFLRPKMWTLYGRRHRASRSLNAHISDNLTGGRVVRAFGTQEKEKNRFVGANRRVGKVENDIGGMEAYLFTVYSASVWLIYLSVYALGAWLILRREGGVDYALLLTFSGYISMLSGPVDTLSRFVREWVGTMNGAQRIFEIVDAAPDVVESDHPVHLESVKGDVALEHVTFAYEPGKPVLKAVSFRAPAGQMLGIVGRSGAGKSTLLNLIARLYDVDEGCITIDGVDIRDLSFADLHGLIAMVSQETYIFMGTVAENIAYARPEATHEEIVAAAVAASAHDFIVALPDGYDTVIGPSGRELSGGERQRLSIARAVLTDPRILILDEATASVDTETEIRIQQALANLIRGRTTLSVAHRLSTLRDAADLIVLDEGRIVEHGTHEELIKQKGTYYRLATIQSRALAKRGMLE